MRVLMDSLFESCPQVHSALAHVSLFLQCHFEEERQEQCRDMGAVVCGQRFRLIEPVWESDDPSHCNYYNLISGTLITSSRQ